ncbi:hypothetical protein IHE44_0004572 [Lamprotornis superbus]|uniref:Uncharacterized protein n=1 Tax=Lamprotornis superbus TaxID=245042 RepID=A0A835TZL5_9PASS|nr:hypothetical protein IHE44_0004572 [Lamprotornis superbus]
MRMVPANHKEPKKQLGRKASFLCPGCPEALTQYSHAAADVSPVTAGRAKYSERLGWVMDRAGLSGESGFLLGQWAHGGTWGTPASPEQ